MEIKCTYVAFDGEEFETEEECLDYEDKCDPAGSIVFFDSDGKVDPDGKVLSADDPVEIYGRSEFMYIKDKEKACKFLIWMYDYSGYCIPNKVEAGHLYAYDDRSDSYYDLTEKIDELTALKDRLMEQVNNE